MLIKFATFGGDLNKMEKYEILHHLELGIYLIALIDLLISIWIMNSQSLKGKNLKKIMNNFYDFFEIAFQGVRKCGVCMQTFHLRLNEFYDRFPQSIKKCGVCMQTFHLQLDNFYHRIPECVINSGNIIRKFHTGKINTNLLYFVVSIFFSMIIILLVS